ncbi:MAG: DNA cytosine methyltransferase [Bacteroidales bacterium]|nr:DNA cytosine methyltransferase [Bacteroidales bacterium]
MLNYIDLFAGAGGLSEGFFRAGFKPIAHVEIDEAACFTLKTRTAYHYLKSNNEFDKYLAYLRGEVNRETLYKSVPKELLATIINFPIGTESNSEIHKTIKNINKENIDLIIGGPPCQAYSLVGRARSDDGMAKDPRNYLYVQYAKYLEKYNPKMFVFENVLGLKSAKDGLYLRKMEDLFLKKGYYMQLFTLEANNFGVLQNRKRIIIIGWEKSLSINIPNLESIKNSCDSRVELLFSDLPKLQAGEGIDKFTTYSGKTNSWLKNSVVRNGIDILTQHVARPHTEQDKEIYRIAVNKWNKNKERLDYNDLQERLKTHKNRHSFFDRFKVVANDLPYSHTVVAHIAKDGHYYIHPDIKQNRSITVREAARLQSFPDDYYFEGVKEAANRTAAFKQIGNAVPPIMASAIAQEIMKILC